MTARLSRQAVKSQALFSKEGLVGGYDVFSILKGPPDDALGRMKPSYEFHHLVNIRVLEYVARIARDPVTVRADVSRFLGMADTNTL